jgi:hypothetical protein
VSECDPTSYGEQQNSPDKSKRRAEEISKDPLLGGPACCSVFRFLMSDIEMSLLIFFPSPAVAMLRLLLPLATRAERGAEQVEEEEVGAEEAWRSCSPRRRRNSKFPFEMLPDISCRALKIGTRLIY